MNELSRKARESFVNTAKSLGALGVPNASDITGTINKDLVGVDPWSLNIVTDTNGRMREAVMEECVVNIWYFLREVVRIKTLQDGYLPIHMDEISALSIMSGLKKSQLLLTIQNRQSGCTRTSVYMMMWYALSQHWRNPLLMVYSEKCVTAAKRMLAHFIQGLPSPFAAHMFQNVRIRYGYSDEIRLEKCLSEYPYAPVLFENFEYNENIEELLPVVLNHARNSSQITMLRTTIATSDNAREKGELSNVSEWFMFSNSPIYRPGDSSVRNLFEGDKKSFVSTLDWTTQ